MDLNISCLKWCSLNNCNWCVSLDIANIFALRVCSGSILMISMVDLLYSLLFRICGISYPRVHLFEDLYMLNLFYVILQFI